MEATIVVALVAAVATVSAAAIAAWTARTKTRAERPQEGVPAPRSLETVGQILSANTITAGRDVQINQIAGEFRFTDTPTRLSIDTINFDVRYRGVLGDSDQTREKAAPTLTVAVSNPGAELLLVPRIEIQRLSAVEAIACTFPNDPITGATFDTYDRLVHLDGGHDVEEILPSPLQLKPRETFAIKIGFDSASPMCYEIRLRAYWKITSAASGETTVSDRYLINFGADSSTWRSELQRALAGNELLYVRLWSGWDDLGQYLTQLGGHTKIMCSKATDALPQEFILFDRRAVLIPELPPRDRFFESSRVNRQGLFISDRAFVDRYHRLAESGNFTARFPSR